MILIKALRPLNCIMASFAILIGIILASGLNLELLISKGILAMASGFIISGAGMVINDYFDFKIDKINKPIKYRQMKRFSESFWLSYSIILFAAGIAISMFINQTAFLIALINSVLLFVYSYKLKRLPLIGNISVSYLVGSSFLYGGVAAGNILISGLLGLLAFLSNTGREIIKTAEDLEGDKYVGAKTIAVVAGSKRSSFLASLFILMAVIMSPLPFILGLLSINYIYIVVVSDIVFLSSIYFAFISPKKSQKAMKVAMFIALAAFLTGVLL